jgi:hypothetical protein
LAAPKLTTSIPPIPPLFPSLIPSPLPQIEQLENVERAFVHLDYEWEGHKKDDEHFNPYDQPAYAPPED